MRAKLPKLNFPPVRLRVQERDGKWFVWDTLRGQYLLLTPEEWVRRHAIGYLVGERGVAAERIVQEYPVALNGQPQRADIVVFDEQAHPLLLVECKAADVAIDSTVLAQAVRYNSIVGARYIALTNGITHYCYQKCADDYKPFPIDR